MMRLVRTENRQAWKRALLGTAAGAAVVVLAAWLATLPGDLAPGYVTRDPVSVLGGGWYAGALSTLGVILWGAAAGIALLGYAVARRDGLPIAGFLLSATALSTILMLDDAFLFHEEIAPSHLGVPQRFVYLGYALIVGAWLVGYRETLRRTEWPLLAAVAVLFAASFAVDAWESVNESLLEHAATFFAEDGLKFAGIAMWTVYLARLVFVSVTGASDVADAPAAPVGAAHRGG